MEREKEELEKEIEEIICSQEQIHEPHNLRTRRIGNRIAIEAHVRLDGDMPLFSNLFERGSV